MTFKLETRKCKVSELIKDLDNEEQEQSKTKERLYRLADLYGIETKYKRLDTLEILINEAIEKKQQELINKNLIK
jgi:hypothetical protein